MPKEFSRSKRVAAQIQRELAQLIQLEIKDPRVGMVTLSGVELSNDLSYAKVYFTVLGNNHTPQDAVEALNHASGFLRHELGRRIALRTLPHLTFIYDESVERGASLSALIDASLASSNTEH